MKKLILVCAFLALTVPAFCADGDITVAEVRPDVATWKLDEVRLLPISELAEITFRKVDAEDNPVGEEITVSFKNVPATTECTGEGEDEVCVEVPASNKFNQLIIYIQNQIAGGKTMKWAITNACKVELGL